MYRLKLSLLEPNFLHTFFAICFGALAFSFIFITISASLVIGVFVFVVTPLSLGEAASGRYNHGCILSCNYLFSLLIGVRKKPQLFTITISAFLITLTMTSSFVFAYNTLEDFYL